MARAGALPALAMAILFFGTGGLAALATGFYSEPLSAAGVGFAVCMTSLLVHEAAHLATLRLVLRDAQAGEANHSLANVWVTGPRLQGLQTVATAAAGPVLGTASCAVFLLADAPGWIVLPLAAVHAANLLPLFPDGRMLLLGIGQIFVGMTGRNGRDQAGRGAAPAVHDAEW
ncbi:hypothetical protein CXZ05_06940 [Arthrobacter sp. AFG20]|nr:hypothetical protein CXZ05_06940 [Arthrobacter sp. AFG20]